METEVEAPLPPSPEVLIEEEQEAPMTFPETVAHRLSQKLKKMTDKKSWTDTPEVIITD